jgi:tetratricopeptide (TPR) repeat protein
MSDTHYEQLLRQAWHFQQIGNLTEAQNTYKEAIRKQPNAVPAKINLGILYINAGNFELATSTLEDALELKPNSIEALLNLGVVYSRTGKYAEACDYFIKAEALDQERLEATLNLARVYVQAGEPEKAQGRLEKLMDLNPPVKEAFIISADTKRAEAKHSEAIRVLQAYLKLHPRDPDILNSLANIQAVEGNIQEAADIYRNILQLNPNHYAANLAFGKLLLDHGDYGNALHYLEHAGTLGPSNSEIEVFKAEIHQQLGQFEKAVNCYKRALHLNPEHQATKKELSRTLTRFVPPWHLKMLADRERNEAYEKAISKTITKESVVLDIGTGSGLLSLISARSGAQHVFTCEQSSYIAEVAQEIIKTNGFSSKVSLFQAKSTQLTSADFTAQPNLLVAEIFDAGLIGEYAIPAFRHALEKLCTPNCQVIPKQAKIYGKLMHIPGLSSVNPIKTIRDLNLAPFDVFRVPGEYISESLSQFEHCFLSDEFEMMQYDFKNLGPEIPDTAHREKTMEIPIITEGTLQGVAFWFNLWLDDDIQVSSAPERKDNHWGQALFFFEHCKHVNAGDTIALTLCYNDTNLWFKDPNPST